ncbi:MAG: tRNA lysidine(34) synthetase TilS [Lachnospiraceae bacterium]|nr:tRNA lysidine(34) synthetase TilS [Eubacterium sp.]MBQ9610150.1 tRNA lysidine(34) synthetase TilS [Lachnospiraceae bacterium]
MDKFLIKIKAYMNKYNMADKDSRIVIGLSGGADSVCLLRVMKALGYAVTAVHINHQIRGKEADEDESFCKRLCDELGVELISFHKDIMAYASEEGLTVEEAGRKFRYRCFDEVAARYENSRIAVAHNKNDMAETIIFNMVRGSGLNGLAGIKPVRDNIIRPLLDAGRDEIEKFLRSISQDYVTDVTNLSCDYDRNKIRHIILPELSKINDNALTHICEIGFDAGEGYKYISDIAKELYIGFAHEEKTDDNIIFRVIFEEADLRNAEEIIRGELVYEAMYRIAGRKKDISRKHVSDTLSLLDKETGSSINLIYNLRSRKSYEQLIIETNIDNQTLYNIDISGEGVYEIDGYGALKISLMDNSEDISIAKNIYTKMADYGKIKDNLCIRTPQDGDYIIIDRDGNKKKLSRVFIDCKIDRESRLSWPVIAVGNEIIWVIGLRFSEAYKIKEDTSKIICMNYIRKGE